MKKRGSEENNNEKISQSPKRHHQNEIPTAEKSHNLNIPYDLTVEILSKLPVKPLAKFQCLSKPWSSLITDSITTWSLTKPRLLVISYQLQSLAFSSCTYPINTDKTSVFAEQDNYTLLRGLNFDIVYQYTRGLICCLSTSCHRFAMYNPTTSQSVLLPAIKPVYLEECLMDGFFGYDPVENQYKVLCMVRGRQDSFHVFTLGDSKKQWRNIDQGLGQYISPTMTTRVCINGKIYFRASLGRYGNIPKPNPTRNVLVSFDVRSERFDHIRIPKQSRDLTLVNYQGKLGCMCYRGNSAEIWVLEDRTKKQEWSKIICSMSSHVLKSLGDGTCGIAGVTLEGEVVIMPRKLDCAAQRLYAYYYDPKQNKTRRVEFDSSFKEELIFQEEVRILSVPDHVDNLMSLR